jgi:hypothetical protein
MQGIIALMLEAVSTSETSANFYQTTRRNITEYSHPQVSEFLVDEVSLHTQRYTNLTCVVGFVYVTFKTQREKINKRNVVLLFCCL